MKMRFITLPQGGIREEQYSGMIKIGKSIRAFLRGPSKDMYSLGLPQFTRGVKGLRYVHL
jgi:hypothetical protein